MPDVIDLGSLAIDEGYFLLNHVSQAPFVPAEDSDAEYQHRFTYRDSGSSIKDAAIDLIERAQRKIFLASFRIGDLDLLDALFAAADRLRGGVYIITSWTEASLRRDLSSQEDLTDIDVQAQKKRFNELTRRGIALRGHESCHAKFLVVDDRAALVSSANLETSALGDTPRKRATGENGVVITAPAEVDRLARFFTRLWYAGCTWTAIPGAEYALHQRQPSPSPADAPPLAKGAGVIWTDGEMETGILAALHDVIEHAHHELLLATFSLVGVRNRPEMLLDPLRRAVERNVDVRLLVRSRNNVPGHRADTAALADLGVRILADSDSHAKGVLADGRYGALFSANFDADHGLFNGVEVGVRLDDKPALAEAYRYFLHAMAHADLSFEQRPTSRQLNHGLGARWRRDWPFPERMTVTATNGDWRAVESAATVGPVLWERDRGMRLYVADLVVTFDRTSLTSAKMFVARASKSAQDLLHTWFDHRTVGKSERGCCPAILVRDAARK